MTRQDMLPSIHTSEDCDGYFTARFNTTVQHPWFTFRGTSRNPDAAIGFLLRDAMEWYATKATQARDPLPWENMGAGCG